MSLSISLLAIIGFLALITGFILGVFVRARYALFGSLDPNRMLHKSTEEQLRRYVFMVTASSDYMSLINRDYQYEAVSDSFCVAYHRSREELIGSHVRELWGEDIFRRHVKPNIDRCFEGHRVVVQDKFPFGTMEERYLEVSYNPYRNDSNEVSHAAVVTKDITSYKQVEEELEKAKEEAEKANQAKSDFLAAMSHEIRTPMNAIIGMTDITLNSDLGPQQRDDLMTVKISAENLLNIINDILDLSKIEAGKVDLEHIDFDLHAILHHSLKTVQLRAQERGLNLQLHIDEQVPRYLKGDPHRLRQILLNLLSNAIKFTDEGGVIIRVTDKSDHVSCASEKGYYLLFAVQDSGGGIPTEKQETIFESFSQADSSTTRKHGGTGLGLTICKQLVHLMRGAIWVESITDRGSTFFFTIQCEPGEPTAAGEEAEPGSVAQESGKKTSLHILLAEDNTINAEVARRYLSRLDHHVTVAHNGEEVLDVLRRQSFDLILMDVEMPVLDGNETTRRIRAGEAGKNSAAIPIIAMTAHVQADSQELSFQSGMDEHVSKPVNFYELRAIIDHLMARRSPGSFAPSPQPPEQPLQEASRQALDSSLQEAPPQAPETSIHDAPRQPPVIDEKNALLRMGNDQNLFNDLLLIFYRDLPHRIERLQQAVETGAMEDLRKYAHSLKGTAGTLGAAQCSQTARELEKAAKEDDRETTKLVFQTLYEELRALHTALGSILATRGLIDPESVGHPPER